MSEKFNVQIRQWLTEVSDGCHNLAVQNEDSPDFYVFQSNIVYNPDLLIIGANPGGDTKYVDKLKERNVIRRTEDDLANGSNQYLENPTWKISKPILEMFSDPRLRVILESSVIMNAVYFNSAKVADLKKFTHGKEMITFCKEKSLELIYSILKPKNILFVGQDASKWLGITYNDTDTVLHDGKKSWLIQNKVIENISHYRIHHTSRNYSFNTGQNLKMKQEYLEANLNA